MEWYSLLNLFTNISDICEIYIQFYTNSFFAILFLRIFFLFVTFAYYNLKNETRMDIVCNIDNQYVKYCIVMLTSLFENNKWEKHSIHIISGELSEDSQKKLTEWIEHKYGNKVHFYMVSKEILHNCPIKESYISLAAYYRLFLESILPLNLSKILYLDCDLVVTGSLKDFWDVDISHCAVGCVEDMWSEKADNYTRLNYDASFSYFNSGVLLINLDFWRKIGFEAKAIQFIKDHAKELIFFDQDILNALLHDQKIFLPLKYNLQDGFYRVKHRIQKQTVEDVNRALATPIVIHYTGGKKPWNYNSMHPCKDAYFKYLDMTEWQGERPKMPYSYLVHKVIMQAFYFLHLAPRKYKVI